MSKIKDKKLDELEFAHKEQIFECDKKGYKYTNESKEHLHSFDGRPLIGTSGVVGILQKPLHWWALQVGLSLLGWTKIKDKINGKYISTKYEDRLNAIKDKFSEIKGMSDEEFLQLLDDAYYAHTQTLKDSATKGTDLHAKIEDYIKECLKEGKVIQKEDKDIQPFIDWSVKRVKRFLWSEMHCYSTTLWLGGITDFGFEDYGGKYSVGDIKSSKEAYDSQFWQCAGYDLQIMENGGFDKNGAKIFTLDKPISYYTIFPFGMPKPDAQYNYDVSGCREVFKACLTIYKKQNG